MPQKRAKPERFLLQAKQEERQKKRGKLKIYLGAAPGVGKTYTMLQDALAQRQQGLDIVVGIAESHGRREIENFLKRLEILPCQKINYQNKALLEFDLDAALARNPALLLLDEMAHTNAPGLRHTKRWQDIQEVLDHGIDVYTTLNVQHIESFNDIVSRIIGIHVEETVPDSALEFADTIELIDLSPEDLLKRLQEGKIYFPQQAEIAKEHFFKKGNLIALRELALRFTAECVETQVLLYRHDQGIERIWPTQERILVCVDYAPESKQIIRGAKRLANHLQVEWLAVYVDNPMKRFDQKRRNLAIQNLRFAGLLGAKTKLLTGLDPVKEVINFSEQENITTIIVGKPIRPTWKNLFFKTLADKIVQQSHEINVYIVTYESSKIKPLKINTKTQPISWKKYGITLGVVSLATAIDLFLYPYVDQSNLVMVYLLGVTAIALFGELGPSIAVSLLSVLAYDFFFIPPRFSFAIANFQYVFTLLVMPIVALTISHLSIFARRQAQIARAAERHSTALYTLSRQLASARGVDRLLDISIQYISKIFDSQVVALLPKDQQLLMYSKEEVVLSDKEYSIALWSYNLGQMAGFGTDTLPSSDAIYIPLWGSQGTIGILQVRPLKKGYLFDPEQMRLLEACAQQIGLALEIESMTRPKHALKLIEALVKTMGYINSPR